MRRLLGALVVMVVGACGEDPKPLTGQVRWIDSCRLENGGISGSPHVINGTDSSAGLDLTCSIGQAGGEISVEFRAVRGQSPTERPNIDNSTEAVFMSMTFGAVGRSANNGGQISMRGVGWAVTRAQAIGQVPTMYPCEVVLTSANLETRTFEGKFKCAGLRDQSQDPPRICAVRGQTNLTRDPEWADFSFTNCSPAF